MKVKVTKEEVVITEYGCINEGEYGVNTCELELPTSFEGLTVTATFNNIPVPVTDGECIIPNLQKGTATLGVYAYAQSDGAPELMYSPKPALFFVNRGSYNGECAVESVPTVDEFEQFCHVFTDKLTDTLSDDIEAKQPTLVSGENIKTINGESILGEGDIVIDSGVATKKLVNIMNLVVDCLNDVAWATVYGETRLNALKNYITELENSEDTETPEDPEDPETPEDPEGTGTPEDSETPKDPEGTETPEEPEIPEVDEEGFELVRAVSNDEIMHRIGYSESPPYYGSYTSREAYTDFDIPVEYGYTYKVSFEWACAEKVLIGFSFYNQNVLDIVAQSGTFTKDDTYYFNEWRESGTSFTLPETVNDSPLKGLRCSFKKEDGTDFALGAGVTSIIVKRKVTE